MSRPVWPPRYVNATTSSLLNDKLSNGAFRFGCKLRALAWGELALSMPLSMVIQHTGASRSQVYEYARSLRVHHELLSYDVRNDVFECSFSPTDENPEKSDLPNKSLLSLKAKTSKREGDKSGKAGQTASTDKPPSVIVYRDSAKSWPIKAQWPAIDRAIGASPEKLDLWGKVVTGYILKGWNPRNIASMLEFFDRGEVPGSNGYQPKADKSAGPRPVRVITEEV